MICLRTFVSCEVSAQNDKKTKHGEHHDGHHPSDDGMVHRSLSSCSCSGVYWDKKNTERKVDTLKIKDWRSLKKGK